MLTVNDDGAPSDATAFTLGIDMTNFTRAADSQAGTIHWGAVPDGKWVGDL